MKSIRLAVVALGAIALSGCSTYFAKTRYQDEMLRLCAEQGAPQINRVVELPAAYFKSGQVLFQDPPLGTKGPLTVAGRYALVGKETQLKGEPEHQLRLRMLETSFVDNKTGEVIGAQKRFCRDGGDTLAPNNTIECCASTSPLSSKLFKEARQ